MHEPGVASVLEELHSNNSSNSKSYNSSRNNTHKGNHYEDFTCEGENLTRSQEGLGRVFPVQFQVRVQNLSQITYVFLA